MTGTPRASTWRCSSCGSSWPPARCSCFFWASRCLVVSSSLECLYFQIIVTLLVKWCSTLLLTSLHFIHSWPELVFFWGFLFCPNFGSRVLWQCLGSVHELLAFMFQASRRARSRPHRQSLWRLGLPATTSIMSGSHGRPFALPEAAGTLQWPFIFFLILNL